MWGKRLVGATALGLLLLVATTQHATAHGDTMFVASTGEGAGPLVAEGYDFAQPIVVTPSFSAAGTTFYTGEFPGFTWLVGDEPPSFSALTDGTPVRFLLVSVTPGVSVKLGSSVVNSAGQSALIGNSTPGEHVHPSWQLSLPNGVVGDYALSFRLTTTVSAYSQSAVYSALLTNRTAIATESPTPSATSAASATPTASPTPTSTGTPTPSLGEIPTATPTATTTPSSTMPAVLCPSTPAAILCPPAPRQRLRLRQSSDPNKRSILWRWWRGASIDPTSLGDPGEMPAYALCIYDDDGSGPRLWMSEILEARPECGIPPCWRRVGGSTLVYRGASSSASSTRLVLRPGQAGRTSIELRATGPALPLLPLHQQPTVRARLVNARGVCWETELQAPAVRNDATVFSDLLR